MHLDGAAEPKGTPTTIGILLEFLTGSSLAETADLHRLGSVAAAEELLRRAILEYAFKPQEGRSV